jgi:hypothetical protein
MQSPLAGMASESPFLNLNPQSLRNPHMAKPNSCALCNEQETLVDPRSFPGSPPAQHILWVEVTRRPKLLYFAV